jgi:RNA polymerase sigma-70 factor (ECF subfamily)
MPTSTTLDLAQRLTDFTPRLRSFLRRRVRCKSTADDLTQETLARAWQKLPDLRDEERLDAWLYRMARNLLVDHLRRERPRAEIDPETLAADRPDAVDEVTRCVARAAQCYLGTLPAIYQDALRLAEEQGLAHADVARALGISLTAAKSRIQRGRQLVRGKLEACCRFEFDAHGRVVDCTLRRPCCAPPR